MPEMNIVLASSNKGKLTELSQTLSPLNIILTPQSQYHVSDVPETGLSFVENALIKARHAAKISSRSAIADDSGLVIPSLNGEPGIFSARYAGEEATDKENIDCLLNKMTNVPNKSAYFYCALVFVANAFDPAPIIAVGQFHGQILENGRGEHGFGYDPIFFLPQYQKTAAEIDINLKNQISHRAIASQKLLTLLKQEILDDKI